MATGKQSAANKSAGDDFPILCETCLGPNPYVRMLKDAWGSSCKVCERPFTSFRWRPAGDGMRTKKTEVCQTCARAKNVCQTCLLDLEFGLPVQVRDTSMMASSSKSKSLTVIPQSDGVREYTAAMTERAVNAGEIDKLYNHEKNNKDKNELAQRAVALRNNNKNKNKNTKNDLENGNGNGNETVVVPKYERNRARVCSFFVKGKCTRGLYCPFRHELPNEDRDKSLDHQNLRDRYYGVNDPVAKKIIQKVTKQQKSNDKKRQQHTQAPKKRTYSQSQSQSKSQPQPPDDTSIKSLFLSGVTQQVTEHDIRALFAQHSTTIIEHINVRHDRGFAFVEFDTREHAEIAMRNCHGAQHVNGVAIYVNWGRSKRKQIYRRSQQQQHQHQQQHQQQQQPRQQENVNHIENPFSDDRGASSVTHHHPQTTEITAVDLDEPAQKCMKATNFTEASEGSRTEDNITEKAS